MTIPALRNLVVAAILFAVAIPAIHFPYNTDAPLTQEEIQAAQKYYTEAYQKPDSEKQEKSEFETRYIRVAEAAANAHHIEKGVSAFVKKFNLSNQPVLEIGSGRGYLQDVAQNYTGLDISPSVARFYHRKFILGSATAMPFPDDSFEGVWSIWVFEHVPNPEQAFFEARRVTRDKGLLCLYPAWNCRPWAADGYEVRPYSDFDWTGKIIKASIPLSSWAPLRFIGLIPIRMARNVVARFGPTRLRYRLLTPNYNIYGTADSNAVNSIDSHEALLWFTSRGDECLNCGDNPLVLPMDSTPLIIRVHKPAA